MKSRRTTSKRLLKEALEQHENQSVDDDSISIICRVWHNGCSHPELCKVKCFDDDLERPREHIDTGD